MKIKVGRIKREKVVKVQPATRENVVMYTVSAALSVLSAGVAIARAVAIYRRYRAEQVKVDA